MFNQMELNLQSIRHFHIDHNEPCYPPNFALPGEIENNGYAKFWRVNKVHYGLCETGEMKEKGGVRALRRISSSF